MQARLPPQISLGDHGVSPSPSRNPQNLFLWMLNVKEDTARNCDSSNFQRQDQNAQSGSIYIFSVVTENLPVSVGLNKQLVHKLLTF